MIIVERNGILRRLAGHDDIPNAAGDLGLEVEGVGEGFDTAVPFLTDGLERKLEKLAYITGQLSTHQQVFDDLNCVFTFLACALDKELAETRSVNRVSCKMCALKKKGLKLFCLFSKIYFD